MADQLEVAKDMAIALLSTSGLLLTIIAAFESIFKSISNKILLVPITSFMACIASSAIALGYILDRSADQAAGLDGRTRLIIQVAFACFTIGLGALLTAVYLA